MSRNVNEVEPQQRNQQERVSVNEPAQRSGSGGYLPPTVESEVDSEPELRAGQHPSDAQVNNRNAQSAGTQTGHENVILEARGDSPAHPEDIREQQQVTDNENTHESRDLHCKDVGTQTDDIDPDSATRGRGSSSSSKSVHWPSDEELSTSRVFESSGPSGSSAPGVSRGNFPTGEPGNSRKTGHRYRDPRAVSNGSPPERFESQPNGNPGDPPGSRPGYGGATSDYLGNYNSGMAYDQHTEASTGNHYASGFSDGYAHEDADLPSASDTLTGMPIPTHLMNQGFYNGFTSQTPTAHTPMGQAYSQGFNNPEPGRGFSNFSMPNHYRTPSGYRGAGAHPAWETPEGEGDVEHETPSYESPMTMNRNDNGPVPVPEVTTTCECDFDALFSDMPEPDMNDEFYSHRPSEEDFTEMAAYARRLVNSIHAAHGRLSDDVDDNGDEAAPDDNDETGAQGDGNYWVPGTDERFGPNAPAARYPPGM